VTLSNFTLAKMKPTVKPSHAGSKSQESLSGRGKMVAKACKALERTKRDYSPSKKTALKVTAVSIPVLEERIQVNKKTVETARVRLRKSVSQRQQQIEVPTHREEVDIRRVSIDRVVEQPVPTRKQGGVTIISLHEERLVTTKLLVLTEELHISTRKSTVVTSHDVTLRREEIDIERSVPNRTADHPTSDSRGSASRTKAR
jgi:uncharacterized protein (TIGR02271 family)